LKKKQKTFIRLGRETPTADIAFQTLIDKVFLLLFVHKKKILSATKLIDFAYGPARPRFIRSREGFRVRANNRIV